MMWTILIKHWHCNLFLLFFLSKFFSFTDFTWNTNCRKCCYGVAVRPGSCDAWSCWPGTGSNPPVIVVVSASACRIAWRPKSWALCLPKDRRNGQKFCGCGYVESLYPCLYLRNSRSDFSNTVIEKFSDASFCRILEQGRFQQKKFFFC